VREWKEKQGGNWGEKMNAYKMNAYKLILK
jgi:hypothetical protein